MKPDKEKSSNDVLKSVARYSGLGFQLLLSIFLGYFIGSKTDQWLQLETPWFTLLFIFLFFIASMIYLIRSLIKK